MLLILALLAGAPPPSGQSQMQMTQDAGESYEAADAKMTRQWSATQAHMKSIDAAEGAHGFGYAARLLESQRAWLKFRDAECAMEGGEFAGGSAESMVITQCETQLTDVRTQQLKSLIWDH